VLIVLLPHVLGPATVVQAAKKGASNTSRPFALRGGPQEEPFLPNEYQPREKMKTIGPRPH